jgi:hypothetical protein
MRTLERGRGLDSCLLADAFLDVEVALLNGEGHLFRRFHLKYEKEQNGTFKLSLASDEATASATNAIRPPQARLNAVAYPRYETEVPPSMFQFECEFLVKPQEKTRLGPRRRSSHRRSMMGGSHSRTHSANGNMVRRKTLRSGCRLSTKGSQSMAIWK